ncbi:MAG TPA: hypothetical protein VJR89_03705, partial [Polyangiales bacterium]|nr:hypothetical protein [Polyangiales bacterium]
EAIERLVTALSREIDVRCSSSRTMGANVPPGTQWINWIVNEATSSDVSVVVLTPRSWSG